MLTHGSRREKNTWRFATKNGGLVAERRGGEGGEVSARALPRRKRPKRAHFASLRR